MNTLSSTIAPAVDKMKAKLTELGVVPGCYFASGDRFFILNDNETVTPVDSVPEDARVIDLVSEVVMTADAVKKKAVRFRRFPGERKIKAYVNKKPCKRKAKKK